MYEAETLFSKRKEDEKLEIKSFFLSSCQVAYKPTLDYNYNDARMSYMKDLSVMEIIPQLHENRLHPFGMPTRARILIMNRHEDRLMVLLKDGRRMTWDITCGKLMKAEKTEHVFEEFKLMDHSP